jgi:hypothetical protein
MALVKRLVKGSTLTYQEMDDNLSLLDNKVSGSNGYILKYSGSNSSTSSLLNEIASTVFVYGSFNVSQSLTVAGSLTITSGSGTEFIVTGTGIKIGNATVDNHTVTGSLNISGSATISGSFIVTTGSIIEFQVLDTGVRIGNLSTDIHAITGSLNTTGSVTINNILTIVPTGSLPTTGIASGSFMTSGSGVNLKPYFYNGSTWTALF